MLIINPLSSEVTELICRIPSRLFSHRLSILYLSTSGGFSTVFNKIILNDISNILKL